MSDFVFHDPSGKRGRRAAWVFGLVATVLLVLMAGFAVTLATAARLPRVDYASPRALAALHPEYHKHQEVSWLKALERRKGKPVPAAAGGKPLVVAFHVHYAQNSFYSLKRHINQIDVLAPQWLNLATAQGDIQVFPDPQAKTLLQNSKKRVAVVPLIMNISNQAFDGKPVERLLLNPQARAYLIKQLSDLADRNDWAGIGFDWEELSPRALALYPGFLNQMRAALGPKGRQVWATVPFDNLDWKVKAIQNSTDQVVLMGYDDHYRTGQPGPPAGQGWYEQNLDRLKAQLDPRKTIVALGAYGYDWVHGGPSEVMTFQEATQAAADSSAQIGFDSVSLNPTYSFEEKGQTHEVWFLDAVTLFNEIQVTDDWRPNGYALWRLGTEDEGVWSVLGRPYGEATADALNVVAPGQDVSFDGAGEILRVTGTPHAGSRVLTIDPQTELVSGESYTQVPAAYTVQRLGIDTHPGQVALTFDDGPDGRWTPGILNILKQYKAKGTFFVIGQNMEHRPDLVMREVREGHDVGSHTFTHPNIGQVPLPEAALELNATQRLFQTLTGRSLRLFRPPYLGDADPSTPSEVAPLELAQRLGFISVGLRVDPDDWQKPTSDQIVARVLDQLKHPRIPGSPGQVILLHDAGGDRRETMLALPKLITALRAAGYQIVPVSELAGLTQAQAMPQADRNSWSLAIDRAAFFLMRNFEQGLRILLMFAIVLGVARLIFLGGFSVAHALKTARIKPPELDPETRHLVSVLIPCFNEEAVIETSIRRILASDWTDLEILVLDDGSSDNTAGVVEAAFADETRVRLLKFENGGKARALNRGLALAKGEIVIALDADTQFPPETVGRLARWFADPAIGAVAGNALVGNRMNLITRWQALEYVTAQNLERRALAYLGAVTVVPGAVGAWRRSALEALGGYPTDTLAEDQDLTLAFQQAGWKVTFDSEARAFTESPDTVGGLLKQRFRWSFGTLQCLWKHRSGLWDRKNWALGWVALPQVWLFQIAMTVISPLVDLAVAWSLISAWMAAQSHPLEWNQDDMLRAIAYWMAFVLLDLAAGIVGMLMEPRAPWKDLPWLPLQRFGYRQLMYYVVVRAVSHAVRGRRVGWGKLDRRNTVVMSARG